MKRRYNRNPKYTSIISRVVSAEHPSSHRGFGPEVSTCGKSEAQQRVRALHAKQAASPETWWRQQLRMRILLIAGIDGNILYTKYLQMYDVL